jgi:hypothetical protein
MELNENKDVVKLKNKNDEYQVVVYQLVNIKQVDKRNEQ